MADLLRSPALVRAARATGTTGTAFAGYDLKPMEAVRLAEAAGARGMAVSCMLYRASRLVGITRRLPVTAQLLGPALRAALDGYVDEALDAPAEFDREAQVFASYVRSHLHELADLARIDATELHAALRLESLALAQLGA